MPKGRLEDHRFIRGAGGYLSDLAVPGALHAVFVRAPFAHATIRSIDADAACAAPGVVAVFTAADLAADGIRSFAIGFDMPGPGGRPMPPAGRHALAGRTVRHLGDPVALVVAESAISAADAAELVAVEYDALPAVASILEAVAEGAPAVWPEAPDNIAFLWSAGDRDAVERAFATAAHVIRHEAPVTRVAVNPMEPRAALARVDEAGRMVLHVPHQQPYALRTLLGAVFACPPTDIQILVPDIGGSFGLRTGLHGEDVALLWAARRLGRPVRWVSDRSETFLADDHGRDVQLRAALALDRDGRFLAFDVGFDTNAGAYLSGRSTALINNVGGAAGVYRIPAIAAEVRGVVTHTVPTGPYRGAGRPEATFAIESTIDEAARALGMSPVELRRRNLIGADEMPYRTALTFTYDCGDFAANMDKAAELSDLAGYAARKAESGARGRVRGLGIVNLIEAAGGPYGKPSPDASSLRAEGDGTVTLVTGAISTGQGTETILSRMVSERLGIPIEAVTYKFGDTDLLRIGRGNGGSGASGTTTTAVSRAIERFVERARDLAADKLEAAQADLVVADGKVTVAGTDIACTLADLARDGELSGTDEFAPAGTTFPNGCHVCEVEIDPETGAVAVVAYVAVEDLGRIFDEVLVEGQVHGGVAQGIGQALLEEVRHEAGSGQLVTGSFVDYAMPRAGDMPPLASATLETVTRVNETGAKGVGEAGTVGSLVVVANAVNDALGQLGAPPLAMPATAARVWAAIRQAGERAPAS